jgi:hypothetical protein
MWGDTHTGPTFNGAMDMRKQINSSSFTIGNAVCGADALKCPAKPYQPFRPERRATDDCKNVKNVCGIFTKNVVVGNDRRDFSRSAGIHSPIAQSHYQSRSADFGSVTDPYHDSRGYGNKWARETGQVRVGTDMRNFSTANSIINSVDHNCNKKIPRAQLVSRKQEGELSSNFHLKDVETAVGKPHFATSTGHTHVFSQQFYDPTLINQRASVASTRKLGT